MGGPSSTKLHTEYLVHTLFDGSGELMLSLGTDSVAKRSAIFYMEHAHRTVMMGRRKSVEGHLTVASRRAAHPVLKEYSESCSVQLFASDLAYSE